MDLGTARAWAADQVESDDDVDRFLLAAGVLAASPGQATRFPGVFDPLDVAPAREEIPIVRWVDPTTRPAPESHVGRDLHLPAGATVRVNVAADTDVDLLQRLVDVLATEVGDVVVSTDTGAAPPAPRWTIPLRVAAEGASAEDLRSADRRLSPLIRPVDLVNRRTFPHLLVGSRPWIDRWLERSAMAAGVVIVLGDIGERPESFRLRAAAWIRLVSDRAPIDVTIETLFHLSHNLTIDEAMHRTSDGAPYVLDANPAYLDQTRITDTLEHARGLEQAAAAATAGLGHRQTRRAPRRTFPTGPSATMADQFRDRPFEHETEDAAEAAARLEEVREEAAGREHRFLNASSELLSTRPDVAAKVTIDISPESQIGADFGIAPQVFPDEALDWSGSDVPLEIVLFELREGGGAHRRSVVLPPDGSLRRPAVFDITWPAGTLRARVAVLYRHRFVQTMLLTIDDDGSPPTFEVECVIRSTGADLPTLAPHQASIILNDTEGPRTMVATGDTVAIRTPGDLGAVREKIRSELVRIFDEPEEFASVDGDAYRRLLTELALHGRDLWRILFGGEATAANPDDELRTALRAADHVSILSATPTEILPLEHLYDLDFTPPFAGPAEICDTALAALRRTDPTTDPTVDPGPTVSELRPSCVKLTPSGTCGSDDTKVCPLGFWGMRKVIERHTKRTEHDIDVGFAVGTAPSDDRPSVDISAVLAAANPRADANPTEAWTAAQTELTKRLGDRFDVAADWPAIGAALTVDEPGGLVLLLPHVERNADDEFVLDLGSGPALAANRLDALRLHHRSPVVLLLGCATGAGVHPSDEFPGRFLDAGASMVLATLTLVRGRFVAPLAERLIASMLEWTATDDTPLFGEALLTLRQELLAVNPMVLTVVGYGDADWILSDSTAGATGGGSADTTT